MSVEQTLLIAAARTAHDKAYAPYSNFSVGVALLDETGTVHSGCNVENAAYPLGQCAEATAIGNMVMAGGTSIRHLVVLAEANPPCTPCGGCRQKIREFTDAKGIPVTICDPDGNIVLELNSADLLPHSFGPENIEKA